MFQFLATYILVKERATIFPFIGATVKAIFKIIFALYILQLITSYLT